MNKKPGTSKDAADKLVKNIRRKTRQSYSAEEKIRIVLAGLRWQAEKPEVMQHLISSIPMGRAGLPEEIGPLAVFLASPAAAFITGTSFVIDGGASV